MLCPPYSMLCCAMEVVVIRACLSFVIIASFLSFFFFFFNDTATTEIYTLSLHDALPIWRVRRQTGGQQGLAALPRHQSPTPDRKSTRLNSSHVEISYAVFCLKKKKILNYIADVNITCSSSNMWDA